jgi:hypothetical protein
VILSCPAGRLVAMDALHTWDLVTRAMGLEYVANTRLSG